MIEPSALDRDVAGLVAEHAGRRRRSPGSSARAPPRGRTPCRARDSDPPRARPAGAPEVVPAEMRGGLLDRLLGGDADVGLAGEHGEGRLVAVDVVAAPHVERVEAELAGDDVEHPLAEEVAVAHGPRYDTYVALLLNTAVSSPRCASSLRRPLERRRDGADHDRAGERVDRVRAGVQHHVHLGRRASRRRR